MTRLGAAARVNVTPTVRPYLIRIYADVRLLFSSLLSSLLHQGPARQRRLANQGCCHPSQEPRPVRLMLVVLHHRLDRGCVADCQQQPCRALGTAAHGLLHRGR